MTEIGQYFPGSALSPFLTGMMSATFQMVRNVPVVRLRLNSIVREIDVAVSCKQAVLILLGPDDLCWLSL